MALLTQSERHEVEGILKRAEEQISQLAELSTLLQEWKGDDISLQFISTRREQIGNAVRIDRERLQELMAR